MPADLAVVLDTILLRENRDYCRGTRIHHSTQSLLDNITEFYDMESVSFLHPSSFLDGDEVYSLKGDEFKIDEKASFEADKLLIFSINSDKSFFNKQYWENVFSSFKKREDSFGRIINPLDSIYRTTNKRLLYDNVVAKRELPKKYDVENSYELANLLKEKEELILKSDVGSIGVNVTKLTSEDESKINLFNPREYFIQELVNNVAEKRFMVFGDDLVAARIIHDRDVPWNSTYSPVSNASLKTSYVPSKAEREKVLKVHKSTGLDYSGIDYLVDKNGKDVLLEINAICPVLNSVRYPEKGNIYELGEQFVSFIKGLENEKESISDSYIFENK